MDFRIASVDRKRAVDVFTTVFTALVLTRLVVAIKGNLGEQGSITLSLLPKYISIRREETVSWGMITDGK